MKETKWILFCLCLAIFVQSYVSIEDCPNNDKIGEKWRQFKRDYVKNYSEAEEKKHYEIFKDNFCTIEKHNLDSSATFRMGMNKFGDLNYDEFLKTFALDSEKVRKHCRLGYHEGVVEETRKKNCDELPENQDWEKDRKKYVVKDQGNCSSGWAYSAIDVIENRSGISNLSAEFLKKCLNGSGCCGCECGYAFNVFQFANKSAIPTDTWYEQHQHDSCNLNGMTNSFRITGGMYLNKNAIVGDHSSVKCILKDGPAVVSIRVNDSKFQFAKGGFYDADIKNCPNDKNFEPNHEVLLVGYGNDKQTRREYWIVKNSFGRSWGDNGYLNIYTFNDTNRINCSVLAKVIYPMIKDV